MGQPATSQHDREPSDHVALLLLVIILVLGTIIRFYRLDAQNLWMDEVASLDNARAYAIGGMHGLARFDHVAPLHSLILWLITRFSRNDAEAMRLPSVIAGVLTIPAFYLLAVRLFQSRLTGIISAGLVAISPFAVWYAQEARMYALLLLCGCAYVAVAWPVVYRALKLWEIALLTLITTAGLYTHHFMIFVSIAFGLFLISCGGLVQRRAWIWAATQACSVILFLYWIILTADKLDAPTGMSKPDVLLWTPYTLFIFLYGQSFGPSVREFRLAGASTALLNHALPLAIAAFAALVLGVIGLRRALQPASRVAGIWLIVWLTVPILLAVLITFVTNITYNVRYVIISYPPVIIICALALSELRMLTARIPLSSLVSLASLLLIICMTGSLYSLYFDSAYAKENVQPVAQYFKLNKDPDKIVIIDNFKVIPVMNYYGVTLPENILDIDNRRPDRLADYVVHSLSQMSTDKMHDIWFLQYRSWESDPTGTVRSYLDATTDLVDELDWTGIRLRRYRTRSRLPN